MLRSGESLALQSILEALGCDCAIRHDCSGYLEDAGSPYKRGGRCIKLRCRCDGRTGNGVGSSMHLEDMGGLCRHKPCKRGQRSGCGSRLV